MLEREPKPGGLAASFEVEGIRVDHGSHRLHPTIEPRILADLRGLLGGDLQRRPRNGRLRLEGRWIRFPLRPLDLLVHLPPAFAAAAARDAATAWARRPRADTFAEILRAGLGPTMCERFYFPYARKLWGLEPDQIDAEQARRRVTADSAGKLLGRLARGLRNGQATFWYPRHGFGALTDRLADAATARGAELRLSQQVTGVELAGDHVRVEVADGPTVTAGRVLSTIPLPLLAHITGPRPAAAVLAAARQLQMRAMLLIYLAVDGGRYTTFDAHYLPDAATPVSRVSEPTNYRDGDDPADRSVLCAELPCARGGEWWQVGDESLYEVAIDALRRAGLPTARVRGVAVRRLPSVYPVYRKGFAEALSTLDAWVTEQPRLLTIGRQGLFVHDNTHHTLGMAWAATDAMASDGTFDEQAWAAARAGFASHAVED